MLDFQTEYQSICSKYSRRTKLKCVQWIKGNYVISDLIEEWELKSGHYKEKILEIKSTITETKFAWCAQQQLEESERNYQCTYRYINRNYQIWKTKEKKRRRNQRDLQVKLNKSDIHVIEIPAEEWKKQKKYLLKLWQKASQIWWKTSIYRSKKLLK